MMHSHVLTYNATKQNGEPWTLYGLFGRAGQKAIKCQTNSCAGNTALTTISHVVSLFCCGQIYFLIVYVFFSYLASLLD
jgi:hypothetical protein